MASSPRMAYEVVVSSDAMRRLTSSLWEHRLLPTGVYDQRGVGMLTIVNVEQAKAWDGTEGEHWAKHADRYERSGWRHWRHIVDANVFSPTDDVLDIGCGT